MVLDQINSLGLLVLDQVSSLGLLVLDEMSSLGLLVLDEMSSLGLLVLNQMNSLELLDDAPVPVAEHQSYFYDGWVALLLRDGARISKKGGVCSAAVFRPNHNRNEAGMRVVQEEARDVLHLGGSEGAIHPTPEHC